MPGKVSGRFPAIGILTLGCRANGVIVLATPPRRGLGHSATSGVDEEWNRDGTPYPIQLAVQLKAIGKNRP
jgi:hypothetical protein